MDPAAIALFQLIREAGEAAALVRVTAAVLRAEESGRVVDLPAVAATHGIPLDDLTNVIRTGFGHPRAVFVVATIYDVPFAWLAGDGDSPDWYADLVQRNAQRGPAWRMEADRFRVVVA